MSYHIDILQFPSIREDKWDEFKKFIETDDGEDIKNIIDTIDDDTQSVQPQFIIQHNGYDFEIELMKKLKPFITRNERLTFCDTDSSGSDESASWDYYVNDKDQIVKVSYTPIEEIVG